eukprot:910942-Pyramimonas_sp.AAC.1
MYTFLHPFGVWVPTPEPTPGSADPIARWTTMRTCPSSPLGWYCGRRSSMWPGAELVRSSPSTGARSCAKRARR